MLEVSRALMKVQALFITEVAVGTKSLCKLGMLCNTLLAGQCATDQHRRLFIAPSAHACRAQSFYVTGKVSW